jgi:hypothetical protein
MIDSHRTGAICGRQSGTRTSFSHTTTVSPTVTGLTITAKDWQNLYFKELLTILGLSGITLQI